VVCDLGPGFAQAHHDHFGALPFQACRVHFDRRLDSDVPKSKWSAKADLYAELRARIRAVLYAPTYDEACLLLRALGEERRRFKGIGRVNVVRVKGAQTQFHQAAITLYSCGFIALLTVIVAGASHIRR
jgi:hypothetical protein